MGHDFFTENRFILWDEGIEAAYNGKGKRFSKDDFEKFLGPYEAVGGWGAAILAGDLFSAYPDAKVVLSPRDPDDWVQSRDNTFVVIHKWWKNWRWTLPLCGGVERDFRRNAELSLNAWSYGNPFDKAEQRRIYTDHNDRVRKMVPEERLLELDAKGRWKPLCAF